MYKARTGQDPTVRTPHPKPGLCLCQFRSWGFILVVNPYEFRDEEGKPVSEGSAELVAWRERQVQ